MCEVRTISEHSARYAVTFRGKTSCGSCKGVQPSSPAQVAFRGTLLDVGCLSVALRILPVIARSADDYAVAWPTPRIEQEADL